MSKKKELIKNTIIIFVGKLCTQMISFFLLPLYTSYLVSEEYGIVDLITTYVSLLVPILSLQLEMAIFRFLVDVRNDESKKKNLICVDIISLFMFICIALSIFFVLSLIINIKYGNYIFIIIIVNMISSNFMQISRGLGRNIDYSIASVITGGITILFNVIFIVALGLGAKGMLLAMMIGNIFSAIFLFIRLKLYKFISIKHYKKELLFKLLKYSMPLIPNGISWWIMSASDRTIINVFLGASANGIYAVSGKFPGILSSFFGIFNLSWSESASLSINDKDNSEFFSSIFNDTVKLFSCLGLLIIAVMPFAFNILIKGDYNESYKYIPILIISSIASLITAQYGSIYIAKKKTTKIAVTTFISAIINLITHLCLVKYIGLYAASFSTLISYVLIAIYRHYDISKIILIKYENTIFLKTIFMYCIIIYIYYSKNILLFVFGIIISLIYSILINRRIIKDIIIFIKNKIVQQ